MSFYSKQQLAIFLLNEQVQVDKITAYYTVYVDLSDKESSSKMMTYFVVLLFIGTKGARLSSLVLFNNFPLMFYFLSYTPTIIDKIVIFSVKVFYGATCTLITFKQRGYVLMSLVIPFGLFL